MNGKRKRPRWAELVVQPGYHVTGLVDSYLFAGKRWLRVRVPKVPGFIGGEVSVPVDLVVRMLKRTRAQVVAALQASVSQSPTTSPFTGQTLQ